VTRETECWRTKPRRYAPSPNKLLQRTIASRSPLNGAFRICFRWSAAGAEDVEIVDDH
jgi:hypothetical protein